MCEAAPEMAPGGEDWQQLTARVREERTDVFSQRDALRAVDLCGEKVDEATLLASHQAHEAGMRRLAELGAPSVLGTHPVYDQGRSVNEAFVWRAGTGVEPVHTKQFFPDEEGYYEARWFARGVTALPSCRRGGRESWLSDLYRGDVQRVGATLRARGGTRHRGSTGGGASFIASMEDRALMAAIVSGCCVDQLESRGYRSKRAGVRRGGWIFDPGDLIAETSRVSCCFCEIRSRWSSVLSRSTRAASASSGSTTTTTASRLVSLGR